MRKKPKNNPGLLIKNMDQEFRIPTKSQERVQNRDIIHDCISNFAGHNCGQELKYSCSCKVGFKVIAVNMVIHYKFITDNAEKFSEFFHD